MLGIYFPFIFARMQHKEMADLVTYKHWAFTMAMSWIL